MKKSSFKVSDLGEKELINRIISRNSKCSINNSNSNFPIDFKTTIGDDAALINHGLDDLSYLVSSSDMLIQSTHFPADMSYYQMGYKSVVVNVSDLAAMGAKPIAFLLNLAIPGDMLLDDFDELICGVTNACNDYQMPLVGGDTNEANEIIISATALGNAMKDNSLMKYGFSEGDLVCLTGEVGLAALGFELLANENKLKIARTIDSSFVDLCIFKVLKPSACLNESFIFNKYSSKFNISCTDITDGLASELYELLAADKNYLKNIDPNLDYSKAIVLYENSFPIDDEFKEIAKSIGVNYLDLFFYVGEDFELLFTIPKDLAHILNEELDFYIIGEVVSSEFSNVELIVNGDVSRDVDNEMNLDVDNKINMDIDNEVNLDVDSAIYLSGNESRITIDSKGYEHLLGNNDG